MCNRVAVKGRKKGLDNLIKGRHLDEDCHIGVLYWCGVFIYNIKIGRFKNLAINTG